MYGETLKFGYNVV